jgi:hypothetical protein
VRLRFRPTDRDLHPAVIVSNDEYCADPRILRVNVLHGTKVAPGNPARAHQVLLNSAEGLDFLTAIDCGYVYGVNKDDINVRIHGNMVQIDAEIRRESQKPSNGDKMLRTERFQGNVSRSFSLAQDVDESKVKAHYDKGVLSLELPKKAPQDYRKVTIQ